jgi:PIN domain nuclease of toxin-antitoxin system
VWLYAGAVEMLSARARHQIDADDLYISPAAILELEYLYEIKRVTVPATEIVSTLSQAVGLRTCDLSFPSIISAALRYKWVRDPFDRMIVAHAAVNEAPLITREEKIRQNYPNAVW